MSALTFELTAPTPAAVKRLAQFSGDCISFYLPAQQPGARPRSSPSVLLPLLQEAASSMRERGLNERDIAMLLAPLHEMAEQRWLDEGHSQALAVFRCESLLHLFWVPLTVPAPVVFADDRFHILPLLATMASPGEFYVLALSRKHPRLIRCHSDHTVEREPMPSVVEHFFSHGRTEKGRTTARAASGNGTSSDGPAASETHDRFREFCFLMNHFVQGVLKAVPLPVVLSSTPEDTAVYREVSNNCAKITACIDSGPDTGYTDSQLVEFARARLADEPLGNELNAVAHVRTAEAANRTTPDADAAFAAARSGNVHQLFLAQTPHGFTPPHHSTTESVLNAAAVETLRHGGKVWMVPATRMPVPSAVLAELRY